MSINLAHESRPTQGDRGPSRRPRNLEWLRLLLRFLDGPLTVRFGKWGVEGKAWAVLLALLMGLLVLVFLKVWR